MLTSGLQPVNQGEREGVKYRLELQSTGARSAYLYRIGLANDDVWPKVVGFGA